MKKFDELEKIVKKHFPDAKYNEKTQHWMAVTRPNSKDADKQPETLVAFDKEASTKFYSYMSSNSWDNKGNIEIGIRKNIFETMKHIHTFESFLNESISEEAGYLHAMTGCGQSSAQNFIDKNNIDAKKLIEHLKRSDTAEKYRVRDIINGTAPKSLVNRYIKEYKK